MYARRWCSCADALVLSLRRAEPSRKCSRMLVSMVCSHRRSPMRSISLVSARHFKVRSSGQSSTIVSSATRSETEVEDEDVDSEAEDDTGDDEGDSQDEDEFATESEDVQAGDGEDGGGIVLGNTPWGQKALEIAQGMLPSDGDLAIYAFKASQHKMIQIRLDKLSDEFGSPSLDEVTEFSTSYGALLEDAKRAGSVPGDIALEVSSPGAERVVQVPGDLSRFKEFPMQVCYTENEQESEAVFELDSFDAESQNAVWKLANVRVNREALGKGRVLNKKQREWRLELPFSSLKLVRLHVDG